MLAPHGRLESCFRRAFSMAWTRSRETLCATSWSSRASLDGRSSLKAKNRPMKWSIRYASTTRSIRTSSRKNKSDASPKASTIRSTQICQLTGTQSWKAWIERFWKKTKSARCLDKAFISELWSWVTKILWTGRVIASQRLVHIRACRTPIAAWAR